MKIIPLFEEVAEIDEEVSAGELVSSFRKSDQYKQIKKDATVLMSKFTASFDDVIKPLYPDVDQDVFIEAFNDSFNSVFKEFIY